MILDELSESESESESKMFFSEKQTIGVPVTLKS